MNRHLRPFAGLCICAGLLFTGYVLVPAPGVQAKAAVPRDRPAAASPTPIPETRISAVRPPVPLLVNSHSTYFNEDQASAATAQGSAPSTEIASATPEADTASPLAAKAAIEADGYRNVSALVKAPDGTWAGMAMRGATQVAIKVDATGSVSQQ